MQEIGDAVDGRMGSGEHSSVAVEDVRSMNLHRSCLRRLMTAPTSALEDHRAASCSTAISGCLLPLVLEHKQSVLAFVELDIGHLPLDRKRHGVADRYTEVELVTANRDQGL